MTHASRRRVRLAFAAAVVASLGFGAAQAVAEPRAEAAAFPTCEWWQNACYCGLELVACVSPGNLCPQCP